MLDYTELKKGSQILLNNEPYEIIEAQSSMKARGSSTLQTKLRNLKTGNVVAKAFHPSDSLEEPEIERKDVKYIYSHKDKYAFTEKNNPSKRFELTNQQIEDKANFLTPNVIVQALVFNGEVINISLPIKMNLKVKEAPPSVKGESQSGGKMVVLETGFKLSVPSFIKTGDVVEINTTSGEYVRRIE